jgi:hypothetical protein
MNPTKTQRWTRVLRKGKQFRYNEIKVKLRNISDFIWPAISMCGIQMPHSFIQGELKTG